MVVSCFICGESITADAQRFSLSDRRKGLSGNWQMVKCNNCGVISMEPMATDAQLAAYYSNYHKDEMVNIPKKITLAQKIGSSYPNLRKLLHRLNGGIDPRDFIKVTQDMRVLDYGCGHGGFLGGFHEMGVSISGAEVAEDVVKECQKNGYDVHKVDDFSHIPFNDEEFDIVYLMQVFEHLRDPHVFMNELRRILKSGGHLYLALPNANSIWRKVFGKNWVSGWFAPFHLFHYNSQTLKNLAMQHGFDVVESWSSTPVFWFRLNLKAWFYSKENQLDSKKSWLDNRLLNYLLMLVIRIIEIPFTEKDCLVIKLKKRVL